MVGAPYTKVMNSNNDVDMAAAVIVCSAQHAESLGVPRDRWVFPHAGTDCHEHAFISDRDEFFRTPAVEIGSARAMALAGVGIDDIDHIDLYSCFPSAVQLGAKSLGLNPYSDERQLTQTGGLAFAGGPWNNYVMHAIAAMVRRLRDDAGSRGLVWANGGYATKHAFGVYSTEPPATPFRHDAPQEVIDALPRRSAVAPADLDDPSGRIEAYTVMHERDGSPGTAWAAVRVADGRRMWARDDRPDVAAALLDGEWVGRRVVLDATHRITDT
jgi:acetyl-CoA C-acetyltransferase